MSKLYIKILAVCLAFCLVGCLSVGCIPTDPMPTEPSAPTEPPVDPTEPPVDPTEPPVDPTDPPVDPTDPPVDPTDPTDPPHTHTPGEDDGDCTTDILCTECGEVAVPGAENHTPAADDGDCTTDIICTVCGKVTIEGAEGHTPAADDGDCTTDITCTVCGKVTTEGAEGHTPAADDGDCTTDITCTVCGKVTTEGAEGHTPAADDGDCTTDITCTVCGKVTAEGNETHSFGTNEPVCTVCGTANPDYVPPVKITDFAVLGGWVDSHAGWSTTGPKDSYDGNDETKWAPQVKPGFIDQPGITYVLNRPTDIEKITIKLGNSDYILKVYTSTDGVTFTQLAWICPANWDKAFVDYTCVLDGLALEDVTHIKVLFTGKGNNGNFLAIHEVSVSEEGTAGLDTSWHIPEEYREEVKATVTAGVLYSNGVHGSADGYQYPAEVTKAYDGNTTTQWNVCLKNYTSETGFTLYLDNYYDLTKLKLTFTNPHYFKIYVSGDLKTFTELANVSNDDNYDESGTVCTLDGLNAEKVKYVRIVFTGRAPSNSLWVGLYEFETYGRIG